MCYQQEHYIQMSGWTHERLMRCYVSLYEEEIKDWEWDSILSECSDNAGDLWHDNTQDDLEMFEQYDPDSNQIVGYSYLGSVFSTMPSGKYWTWWSCSNVNRIEQIKDTAFMEALEYVADEHDCWIESGEGDPCDLYICQWVELE